MNKKQILFFDDEKELAEILQKNLELFNFDVTLVSTITDFFEKIDSSNLYNLIIMDIMAPMPSSDEETKKFSREELSNMDNGIRTGDVLVNKIRNMSESKYSNIPILFYSARVNVSQYERTKHIRKPALVKNIVEEITNLLN